jgi:Fe2+ or Zn2+ uptake regulation protein
MPTVLRFEGLRVVIYPNDHRPAHVHVVGRGCEAVFHLQCPAGPAELRENYGFSLREITQIGRALAHSLAELCAAWEGIHGNI